MSRPPALLCSLLAVLSLLPATSGAATRRNAAPSVNAGADQSIGFGTGTTVAAIVTDDGLPSGKLSQTWTKVSGPGTVKFGSTSSKSTTASFSLAGTYRLRLTASDTSLTAWDELVVTVKSAATNQYPTVYAGTSQSVVLPTTALLAGTVTDDGLPANTLSTTWSVFSGPGAVTFGNANTASTAAAFSNAGTYVLRLTANDGSLAASADVSVTVAANQPPVVSAGASQTLTLPGVANLSGSASDDGAPAGSTVRVAWSTTRGPGTVVFGTPSAVSTTAAFSAAGTYVLRLTATDGAASSYAELTATVNASSVGGPAQVPVPATLFGMHLIDKGHWPTYPFGALGKGTFINWPYIEPTKGVRNWTNLDAWVDKAYGYGVPMFFAFEMAPAWAVSDQSTCVTSGGYTKCFGMPDLAALDSFVTALATRYKGKIAMYELYNEPDISQEGARTLSAAEVVTIAQHEYDIIRAVDPAALIASPSGGSTFMDQYYAAGGVKSVDVLAYHLYPDPTRYTTSQYAAAERINYWPDGTMTVAKKYGLTQPLWNTEGSWNTAAGVMANDADQMAYVARSYLLHWSKGFQRAYWYASDHDRVGVLWDAAMGERAAARAYRQVQRWMVGATMPAACATSSASVMFNGDEPAQYECTLTRPGGYQAVAVWNTNGATSYTPPSIYRQYRDLDGNVTPITGPLTIGFKPLLLETGSAF